MTTENSTRGRGKDASDAQIDDSHLPSGDVEDSDAVPLSEVSGTVPTRGVADVDLGSVTDGVDIGVVPIREPAVEEDVTLNLSISQGHVQVSLPEDDVLALCDAMQQALQVEDLE